MCKPASFIVVKGPKAIWSLTKDRHFDIRREFGLPENGARTTSVQVEVTPAGNDFALPLDAWSFHVDQDCLPEWWSRHDAEKECRIELEKWARARLVRSGERRDVKDGEYVTAVCGGTVENVWGGTIKDFRGGTVEDVWGGTVEDVWGGAIKIFHGGTIKNFGGGTLIKKRIGSDAGRFSLALKYWSRF